MELVFLLMNIVIVYLRKQHLQDATSKDATDIFGVASKFASFVHQKKNSQGLIKMLLSLDKISSVFSPLIYQTVFLALASSLGFNNFGTGLKGKLNNLKLWVVLTGNVTGHASI